MLAAGSGREKDILPVVRGGQDVADQRERAGDADDPVRLLRGGHGQRGLRRPRGVHARARGQQRPQRVGRGGARIRGGGEDDAGGQRPEGGEDAARVLVARTPITKVTGRPGKYARSDAASARAPAGLWAPSRMTSGSRRKTWKRPGQRAPREARADRAPRPRRARAPPPPRAGRCPAGRRPAARRPRRRCRQSGPVQVEPLRRRGVKPRGGDAQVAALERAAARRPRAARRDDDRRGLRILPRREGHAAPDDRGLLGRDQPPACRPATRWWS